MFVPISVGHRRHHQRLD